MFAALALGASGSAQASFQVVAFSNGPGYAEIVGADYVTATKKARRGVAIPNSLGFEISANLCIATLLSNHYEQAVAACNDALNVISSNAPAPYYQQVYNLKNSRSVLHSNRGVAHALSGHLTRAQRDFERALALDPANQKASNNLQHLLTQVAHR